MSDVNTLDLTNLSSEPVESNVQVEITDAPAETEGPSETEGPAEESAEVVVEPVVATPDPVPEPVAPEEVVEPAPTEVVVEPVVSTEEVVENVKEILNSDNTISCNNCNCEERVKVLEERLDKLIDIFSVCISIIPTTRNLIKDI